MSQENVIVSEPVQFDTVQGKFQVIFSYEPDKNIYLTDESEKTVHRDTTTALLTSVPYNPWNANHISNLGYAFRRPTENQNKVAARLYALADAAGGNSRFAHGILDGYLRYVLKVENRQLRNMIIENMRLQK